MPEKTFFDKRARGLIVLFALAVAVFQAWESGSILKKGQIIKQFYAHSITQSLADNGFRVLETKLPCADEVRGEPRQRWVEEPPVFHVLAALFVKAGASNPALPGLATSFFLMFLIWSLSAEFRAGPEGAFLGALAVATPVFMRYFSQHMPDLLSVLFLAWGVVAKIRKREGWALTLFIISCTVKILAVFPVAAIFASDALGDARLRAGRAWLRSLAVAALKTVLVALPFVLWLKVLKAQSIPNPFAFDSVLRNRHSGDFGLLLRGRYWAHFFTWVAAKGVGIPLFFFYLVRTYKNFSAEKIAGIELTERLLMAWSLGLILSWFAVRAGNFTHDYYFLPFFIPIALLGADEMWRVRPAPLKAVLIGVSLTLGLVQPFHLARGVRAESPDPTFCGLETGLPAKTQ